MQHRLENALAGLAALLIFGAAITSEVVVPPADPAAGTDGAPLALPVLA